MFYMTFKKYSDKYIKKQYNICQLWITVTIKENN